MLMAAILHLHAALIFCFLSTSMHAKVAQWKSATATYSTDTDDSIITGEFLTLLNASKQNRTQLARLA